MLVFYGASDDLVEVEGDVSDEFPGDDCLFVVTGAGLTSKVRVRFEPDGCWSVGLSPAGEGVAGHSGSVEIEGYTARLTLPEATGAYLLKEAE